MADIAQIRVNNTDYNFADDTKVPYDLLQDTVGFTSKNLIPFPYQESNLLPLTRNGVTFTDIGISGSIKCNGTSNNNGIMFRFLTKANAPTNFFEVGKKYVISGGSTNVQVVVHFDAGGHYASINGNEIEFTPTQAQLNDLWGIWINISSGVSVNNEIVYPMLRKADIMDSTYEPYNPSVKQVLRNNKIIEGKNLLKSFKDSIKTVNGITYTVNADNTITANGTATADAVFTFFVSGEASGNANEDIILNLAGKSVIMSGCPSGGSTSTYYLKLWVQTSLGDKFDTGNGVDFTVPSDVSSRKTNMQIVIKSGQTVSNLVFKPMIRFATETDSTYEQYYIPGVVSQEAQNILGAKNLIGGFKSITHNGVTFTVNDDGTIIANGTASGGDGNCGVKIPLDLVGGRYILSGCPKGAGYLINGYRVTSVDGSSGTVNDTGNGVEFVFRNVTGTAQVVVIVQNGYTADNLVFKPMLRLADVKDDTYVPYAMTNRELTEVVTRKEISNVDVNDITDAGIYYMMGSMTNTPGMNYGMLEVVNKHNYVRQIIYPEADGAAIYARLRASGTWQSWYKFTGTVVS